MTQRYDIAVIGGGLAGASLACALAGRGLSIALVEATAFEASADDTASARTTALAWGTRALFESLDLWADMARDAEPIVNLHVGQQGRLGSVRVRAEEYDLPALGYVVPNATLVDVLRRRLDTLDGVDVVAPARFVALSYREDGEAVTVEARRGEGEHGETFRFDSRLLVGADGARSSVRDALGIRAKVDDYAQRAIVTSIEPERLHDGWAFERFTPEGPLAILPRDRRRCAVVWALPTERAEALVAAEDTVFESALQSAFGHRLGRLAPAGGRGSYPLARVLCDRATARRAALVGNAGHALHPAAAQGFNLAIRDALVLAGLIAERQSLSPAGFDPGDADLLAAWAEARQPDQHRVANFTDAIVRLFSNRLPLLDHARGLGLLGLSLLPELRADMARRSMGLAVAPRSVQGGRA